MGDDKQTHYYSTTHPLSGDIKIVKRWQGGYYILKTDLSRLLRLITVLILATLTVSCYTTYSVPAAVCLSATDNPGDDVWRYWGYAYPTGESVYQAWLNCPVNLPQDAEIKNIRCGVKDTDSSGYAKMYLYKMDMLGATHVLAYAQTEFDETPGNTVISDNTISSPIVDNVSASYYLRVYLQDQRIEGGSVRLNMCVITYD